MVEITEAGLLLLSYKVYIPSPAPVPSPAAPMAVPERIKSVEELWLCGMHLEQYRHATREPMDYYEEALRREPFDIRTNNSVGLLMLRRGLFSKAIPHFENAIKRQTEKNPNPYHGESYFNLGLALFITEDYAKAYDAFFKATWSAETQGPAFYRLGCIKAMEHDYRTACDFAEKALVRNCHDVKARLLKLAVMRKQGIDTTAFLAESVEIDRLYMGFAYESALKASNTKAFKNLMHSDANNFLELAIDYMNGGFWSDALNVLTLYKGTNEANHPMVSYYKAYCAGKLGDSFLMKAAILEAEGCSSDMVFPNKIEDIKILSFAIEKNPSGAFAPYYLGNLYYDKKQYKQAAELWMQSIELDPSFAMNHRNMAIYCYNKEHNSQKALAYMRKAVDLDPDYPRFLLELDQLMKKAGENEEVRFSYLSAKLDIVTERDDLFLRYINLLNHFEKYSEALELLSKRTFHPWEGGEGKVVAEYKKALIGRAQAELYSQKYNEAITDLIATLTYPDNLGEGKLPNVNDNETYYLLGKVCKAMGDHSRALEYFKAASEGILDPTPVLYYNDQPSDYIYYIGLANIELGRIDQAKKAFNQLISYSDIHIFDKMEYDYFAVSLPEIEVFEEDIQANNTNYCKLLKKLGTMGMDFIQQISIK